MNTRICLKSDGTIKTGKRIIEYLELLGGRNVNNLTGRVVVGRELGGVYWIKNDNIITYSYSIPEGYTLIVLPEETNEEIIEESNDLEMLLLIIDKIKNNEKNKKV